MEALFNLVPILLIVFAVGAAVALVRRSRRVNDAWTRGITAQARCVRTYTTTSGGGNNTVHTTLHHVYEFTTRDGRLIRFDEEDGPSTTVEGDIVTVHYLPERPEHATAKPPARAKLAATTCGAVLFLAVFAAFAVFLMIAWNSDGSMP
ncbi:DUF3592 domain-containing protein [Streptomyces neyagawaensis]|uniref:DUF3592 domain-containing protein n=1 Tax=Streptomyces neyagawaensis TaxID=42238 RepID=UPI0006E3C47B|nr:DUF3592 domain-containing protein [Streptomyces neyagawaensis]MCL6734562.1 DUF3592 domain-containing protein [Streptomyces neyagawaensis]MDE1685676.1 DUF3592 domain-containing protein [Streptomyces neyagawaensis]